MAKFSIMDVVELAKAGYKPGEVKEIIAMANVTEETPESAPKESESTEAKKEPETTPVASPELDYKQMFETQKAQNESMQKQIDELNSKLASAQKTNISSDVSGNHAKVSTSETINNIFKDVIS